MHNWSILGLLFPFFGRWLCFPIMAWLIPGQKNPSHFVSTPEGLRPANFWDVAVSNILSAWELLGQRALRVIVDGYFANVSFIKPLMEKGIAVISRRTSASRIIKPRPQLQYSGGGNSAALLLHLEIDVAAQERIHMVGRCGAKGNKGVHVRFCTCKARIETFCHQANYFKFRTEPGL